jgi:hypothetical protein
MRHVCGGNFWLSKLDSSVRCRAPAYTLFFLLHVLCIYVEICARDQFQFSHSHITRTWCNPYGRPFSMSEIEENSFKPMIIYAS